MLRLIPANFPLCTVSERARFVIAMPSRLTQRSVAYSSASLSFRRIPVIATPMQLCINNRFHAEPATFEPRIVVRFPYHPRLYLQ